MAELASSSARPGEAARVHLVDGERRVVVDLEEPGLELRVQNHVEAEDLEVRRGRLLPTQYVYYNFLTFIFFLRNCWRFFVNFERPVFGCIEADFCK